ncbi:MAG: FAD-binding oxidoreductase [Rhodospirillaceae bacterium]|nr:FAD-binding oxidoreductase [Rhodospirillaceae bacterium]
MSRPIAKSNRASNPKSNAVRLKAAAAELRDLLGPARVLGPTRPRDPALRVRPGTVAELCRAVAALGAAGVAMFPQGGGTHAADDDGLPVNDAAVIELADLNRIVEINEADRYVTVEAGCTWAALDAALKARRVRAGVRAPLVLAPGAATVGGAVSTNAVCLGSGARGTANDAVLGLDVVLADGSLVETGAAAAEGRTPFLRHFGPDLTGLFLGDCGSFGIKAHVTLPLCGLSAHDACVSFAFERFEDVMEAQVAITRLDVAAAHWALDPACNDRLAARGIKFLEGLTYTRDVIATAKVLVDGHRTVMRGGWTLHVAVEGDSEREIELKLGKVRRTLVPTAMKELPGAVAQQARGQPFTAFAEWFGPSQDAGWSTLHGLFPLSRAAEIAGVTDEYFIRHREAIARHGIDIATITVGLDRAVLIQPILRWTDPGAAAKSAAATLRRDLALLWGAFGASHFGLGTFYPYAGALSSAALAMVRAMKQTLDPKGLMNPGALGLAQPKTMASLKFAEFPQNLLEDH